MSQATRQMHHANRIRGERAINGSPRLLRKDEIARSKGETVDRC